jgi:hypothetical protein
MNPREREVAIPSIWPSSTATSLVPGGWVPKESAANEGFWLQNGDIEGWRGAYGNPSWLTRKLVEQAGGWLRLLRLCANHQFSVRLLRQNGWCGAGFCGIGNLLATRRISCLTVDSSLA